MMPLQLSLKNYLTTCKELIEFGELNELTGQNIHHTYLSFPFTGFVQTFKPHPSL